LLQRELNEIQTQLPNFYPAVKDAYDRIERGERDIFF